MRMIDADELIAMLNKEFDDFVGNSYLMAEKYRELCWAVSRINRCPTVALEGRVKQSDAENGDDGYGR